MPKLKWGLIGCGDIAKKRVAPALRDLENCELVGVSRARPHLAESFATEFGARNWYGDWKELIADAEVQAVYVASPVYLHARQTIAAAAAGKHVLCEKPMAMNVQECSQMIEVCRSSGVRLGVAYYRHFYPVVERIKAILDSGEIGPVVFAQLNAFEWFNPGPEHPRHWFVEPDKAGGGPMFDFGCHRIEVLMNLLGPIQTVSSLVGNVLFERRVEDTAVALFEFRQGTRAVLSVTHAVFEPQDTLDLYGSQGSVRVPVLNQGNLKVRTGAGERQETHPPHANLHQPLIDDFTRAVLEDRTPAVDGQTGRQVARLEEMIYGAAAVKSRSSLCY